MNKSLILKRIFAVISVVLAAAVFCFIGYFTVYKFLKLGSSAQGFTEFIKSYGIWGRLIGFFVQFLQVFVALIPGEFVEVGLGLSFGYIEGTIICYLGIAAASAIIFLLVKKLGVRVVSLFVEPKKINELKFINTEEKLYTLVFLLFLIPGTPKDLLTYIVPLTKIKLSNFLIISLIARLPSVISSIIGGNFFGSGRYLEGIILFLVTGAVSLLGMIIYRAVLNRKNNK